MATGGTPAPATGGNPASVPAPAAATGGTAPRAVVFAAAPNLGTNILDYADKTGIKAFEKATKSLKTEYDGAKGNSAVFKEQLQDHAEVNGWAGFNDSDIIHIPTDGNDRANGYKNLITEFSQLSTTAVKRWAENKICGQANRIYQNNYNMVLCLNSSLSDNCRARMSLKKSSYTVRDTPIAALLYKELLKRAEVDTKASSAVTRLELYNLDAKMIELNYDIGAFVAFVEKCETKLASHGEQINSEDLILNIFKGVAVVKDKKYREKMEKLKDDWLNSEITLTSTSLLLKIESSYDVRVEQGDWGALSPEEESIVALKASYENDIKDLRLKLKAAQGRSSRGRRPGNSNKSEEKKDDEGTNRRSRPDPQWKMENPDGLTTLKKNGKTYYWCLNHNHGKGKWVLHKVEDCRNGPPPEKDDDSASKKSLKKAYAAVAEDSDNEDEYSTTSSK